ncbi:MAG TPA: UvrB/UvrC motif-containing protein [Bacillota bacterium]|nr:UvrB/UvrC motif-containing protein [Bacillota bacterium]
MLCERCQERPATVHMTKVINFEKTELHLCEVCAKEAGSELGILIEPNFSFQNLIAGLLEGDLNFYQQPSSTKPTCCQSCGLTFSDFRNNGMMGCGECYRYFREGLEPLLKKMHGSAVHIGKVPKRTGGKVRLRKEIEDLKRQLQQAVAREDYEKAAHCRDEIRRLQQEL